MFLFLDLRECCFALSPLIPLCSSAVVFQSSDFDFLLSKGSTANTVPINSRDSLLLRFDPLLGRNILVAQPTTTTTVPTVVSITNPVSGVAIIKEEPLDESFTSAASTSMQDNNSPDDQQQQQYCLNSTLPLSENTNEAAGQESVFNHQPSSGLATSSKVSTTVSVFFLLSILILYILIKFSTSIHSPWV